ncbi:C39 family peptidase [Dactylosporangium vinaceum]|uniref:C39 family peptidase n=1 Tax=Dactylosporangium vinaceum TaxID=53362 RepID=A0ABV5M8N8_9ACTN|nr:C39 family peptidase [Dactylosporangium vinaceum]UAB94592.1 C39 family peptidase [Dactylosporangium vinaceum]
MSYLYRSRHTQRLLKSPRLPVAAASAVLALAAGLGATALGHDTPPAAAVAAAPETPAPRETKTAASRDKRPEPTQAPVPAQQDLPYQFAWQENFYFCGPAATRIALSARGLTPSQSQVAQALGTTVNGTNSSADTVRALNEYTQSGFYTAHFIRGQAASEGDVAELKQAVVRAVGHGYAVVANIAGSTVDDGGHGHAYPGGHYLTIVGYRDGGDTVKIADPADALGVGSYTLSVKKMADWIALRGYAA